MSFADALAPARPGQDGPDGAPGQKVIIHVNEKPVTLLGHIQTGLQIKQAAIGQGVKIQLDFVLSEELAHDRTRIISDDQRVTVTDKSRFDAIPNDDHS